jgi:ribosome recycling factor
MTDPRLTIFQIEADKVMQHLKQEFSKLQTGRANAALVEHIEVEAYGQRQALRNVAGITVADARTINIQPWDRSVMHNVEKALQLANLGASPVNDGVLIRLNLPPMTEERRSQLKKIVSQLSEETRIALRKHRQTVHDEIKQEKDEDMKETLMENLQKAVDAANEAVAELAKKKEEEVMKV